MSNDDRLNEGGDEGVTAGAKLPPCPGTGVSRAGKAERYPATARRVAARSTGGGGENEGGDEGQTAFPKRTPVRAMWDGSHGDEDLVAGPPDEPTT